LTAFTLDGLRRRRSQKWLTYPPDVLPLWVAEMDTPLADPVRLALHDAVERGDTGYPMPGRLPEAYAEFATRRFGWHPPASAMILVPDVMQGIVAVLEAVTERGSAVVINPPVYPPFFSFLPRAGRRLVECPLVPDGGRWGLDLDRLDADLARPEVGAYLLCNPHNPTGTVFTRAELLAVAELAERHRVRVLVDEIHAPLVYSGATHIPFLSLADQAPAAASGFAVVSASKAWNLAGLKAALVVAGPAAVAALDSVPPDVREGGGIFGVIAAEAALTEGLPWLDALLVGLDANRRLLAALLAKALPEIRYRPPEGTYLAWLDCRELALPDEASAVFLGGGRVAVNAGHTFGAAGAGFVRLNLATHPGIITEAVTRMARAFVDAPAEVGGPLGPARQRRDQPTHVE
jgi:cystathionine beta-lyase